MPEQDKDPLDEPKQTPGSTTPESTTSKPETSKPETPKPETPKPETLKPETPKPETSKPAAAKPVTPEPDTDPEPETPKPETSKPETPEPETDPEPETPKPEAAKAGKMPFTSHLGELRKRLFVSMGAIFALFVVGFQFSEHLFKLIMLPMRADLKFLLHAPFIEFVDREDAITTLVFLAPAEAFWVHMKVAFIAAFIVSTPVIFHQLWKFVSPGLLKKERRYALPFITLASGLFMMGAMFCFLVVLPFALNFLLTYKTASLTPMISVEKYVDFTLKFILAFGVIFELPLVLVFLTRMGLVTPETLSKNRKYAVLLAFVTAAILTPTPDAFNQILMAGPIIILFEAGLLASKLFARRRKNDDSG